MNERTWDDIGNEIRGDYLRSDGPENVRFREVQWSVWLAEVERAAAEKLEAELEARIEDRDYWYRIATEAKDQRDAALAAIAKVRELIDLSEQPDWPGWDAWEALKRVLGPVPSTGEGNE